MKNLTIVLGVLLMTACSTEEVSREEQLHKRYDGVLVEYTGSFDRLPAPDKIENRYLVDLGQQLYFDKRLSKDGTQSCNSCHNLETYGVDNLPTSPGDLGKNGDRNSPTTVNAALHASQFWDGRAKHVEEQAGMPILNPVEMNIPSKHFLVNRLKNVPQYNALFAKAFPNQSQPLTYDNIQVAIGAFERQLITPSRVDDYLNGNTSALSLKEKKGMLTFSTVGCTTCHNGPALGGNMLQKFGVYDNYWTHTNSKHIDNGKMVSTGNELDQFMFKVPALRNIEKTHPYFHDGSVKDLSTAVDIMAKVQLNKELSEAQIENITAFLNALTGEVPVQYQTPSAKQF